MPGARDAHRPPRCETMLRPSSVPGRPRESVFISGPLPQDNEPIISPYIETCVAAALETCDKIRDAQRSLRRGVADLRRMSKVLENEPLFALVNENHVAMYQDQLQEEIEPQILQLNERAEKGIENLERKAKVMTSKLEAAQSRISTRTPIGPSTAVRKLEMLIKQRQALEKEVQSLIHDVSGMEGQLMSQKLIG